MSHIPETTKRLKKWFKDGKKQDPIKVDIFFTERCNLKCRFCNYAKTPPERAKQELSDEKILRLIDEICQMDVKIFGVLGGEPFLRKDVLLKSMNKIKKQGIRGSIVTNGTLLNKKDIEKIVKMEWDLIRFSIDGLENTHDNLRGVPGTFDKIISSIKIFNKIKGKLDSNSPTIEVNFVLNNKNYKELPKLIKKLSSYGINFVYVLPMIKLTEDCENLEIREKDAGKVIKWLKKSKKMSKKHKIKNNINEVIKKQLFLHSNEMEKMIFREKNKIPSCLLPWYTMNITANGIATACAQWPEKKGVKLKDRSLTNVWYKDFEQMRKKINSDELPEWCSRCCVPLVDENIAIRKKLK